MTILDDIIAYKKKEVAIARANAPLSAIEAIARDNAPARGFVAALTRKAETGFALIAEIKKASPSKGVIRADFDPRSLARNYEKGGAACLSVLTDGPSFQGSPYDLKVARAASSLPVLRKDFVIDAYQIAETRAWGADCILLIMACLEPSLAGELEAAAMGFGMDALLETHDEADIDKALRLKSPLIGINNRDLKTFETSLQTTARLSALVPRSRIIVSESGIANHADLQTLSGFGTKAFLVGESLMRQKDVAAATSRLLSPASIA